jgi:hypothetical protein
MTHLAKGIRSFPISSPNRSTPVRCSNPTEKGIQVIQLVSTNESSSPSAR